MALENVGATDILAINAVGGVAPTFKLTDIVIPDQLIDYTYGRGAHVFAPGICRPVTYIDFAEPYDEGLRNGFQFAKRHAIDITQGVYACTQGPRLETAAEVRRPARWLRHRWDDRDARGSLWPGRLAGLRLYCARGKPTCCQFYGGPINMSSNRGRRLSREFSA